MNKAALVEKVHEMLGGTKVQAEQIVNGIFDTIVETVKGGEEVSIAGFGKFYANHRKARTARNPKTGEPVQVPAMRVFKYSPAKAVKDTLRNS